MAMIKRIRLPSEGNTLHPLPEDFYDLSHDGQRQARVAAIQQWRLYNKPEQKQTKGEVFVACIDFFDAWYLSPQYSEDGDIIFDPLFYKGEPLPTPHYHRVFYHHAGTARKVALVAMRGGAKSFMVAKPIIMCMLSCPRYDFNYATSINDLAEAMGDRCKYQLYTNSRIFDDWAGELGGAIAPKRTEGKMGMRNFMLANRSSFFSISMQSRQRGLRPTVYCLDDPEFDPTHSTSMEVLRENMEWSLFHVILPQVQHYGTKLWWTGTYVSQRHYLYHAMQTEDVVIDGKTIHKAAEKRFGSWVRIEVPAATDYVNDDGSVERVSAWPELHPVDEADRKKRGMPEGIQTLEDIEDEIGTPAFSAEYLCKPGGGGMAYFSELGAGHAWWIKPGTADQDLIDNPTKSNAIICWNRGEPYTVIEMPLQEFCRNFIRFETCDTSYTNTADSDYKCIAVMALTDQNELFVLDMWAKKTSPDDIMMTSFKLSDKWRVRVIGTESVGSGLTLYEGQRDIVKTRAKEAVGVSHLPNVIPLKAPPTQTKQDRISSALYWRFEHNLIKLPKDMSPWPWKMLKEQIIGFNPYSPDGGLKNDDCLDVIQMHRQIVNGRPMLHATEERDDETPMDALKRGEVTDETGMPHAWKLLNTMTHDDLVEIMGVMQNKVKTNSKGGILV